MQTRTLIACLISATAVLTACEPVQTKAPETAEPWVVLSVTYSRGNDQHAVVCVVESDLARDPNQRGEHREILIPADHAYDETYDQGKPCPKGPINSRF